MPIRFQDVLDKLDRASEVCRSVGLADLVGRGRFSEHRRKIQELISLIEPGNVNDIPPQRAERLP